MSLIYLRYLEQFAFFQEIIRAPFIFSYLKILDYLLNLYQNSSQEKYWYENRVNYIVLHSMVGTFQMQTKNNRRLKIIA